MWWLLIIALILLIPLILWWRKSAGSGLIPLLEAKIATDGTSYSVEFERLHPETAPVEFLWIVLCTGARFVYIVGDSDSSHPAGRRGVVNHIRSLGKAISAGAEDLFSVVGPSGSQISPALRAESKAIRVRLHYRDALTRMAKTFLPLTWHPLQFHGTLTALAEAGREQLPNRYLLALMGAALESLAEGYLNGSFDPTSMNSLFPAPVEAFHAAKSDKRVIGVA